MPTASGQAADNEPVRILVVDDERALAEQIARGLTAEGYTVDVEHDGLDGLWRAKEVEYSAIVLDIMLPGKNGYQVCRDLRAAGVWTPILMLTAKDGDLDEAEALDTGADDYLRKPFSLVVLLARLRVMVSRGSQPRARTIEIGDLVIDPGRFTCWRRSGAASTEADRTGGTGADGGGPPLELTRREFAVLEMLARRHPDVVSKSALLDAVWGMDFPGDPNIVEVYVGYLRKKLGRDTVRTVRGLGYQLRADARWAR
jgi:two-component system, OmpR family, response regulator